MTPVVEPSVKTYNDEFLDNKKKKIFCYYWEPSVQPRALVHISHGYTEHSMVYEDLAKELAKRNFFVFAHDHVGHGKSDGSRAHFNSFEHLTTDARFHVDMMKKKFPELPIFLIGHSMGGAVAILLALNNPKEFSGIITIAPAILPNPQTATPFKMVLAKLVGAIIPEMPIAYADYSLVSRDPEKVKEIDKDPLRHHGYFKARAALSIINAGNMALDKVFSIIIPEMVIKYPDYSNVSRDSEKATLKGKKPLRRHVYFKARATLSVINAGNEIVKRKEQFDVPYLILHGDDDKVCHISGSELLHKHSSSKDKTLKVYGRAYHSLHFEPDGIGEDVYNQVIEWLEARA